MGLFDYYRRTKREPHEQFIRRLQLKGEFPTGDYIDRNDKPLTAARLTYRREMGMLFDFSTIPSVCGSNTYILISPRDLLDDPQGEWPWRYKWPQ